MPEQEIQNHECGSHVGNPVFWDGSHEGLDQMRRVMPECHITCCVKRPHDKGIPRPDDGLERATLKIDYPGGEVEYVEAGQVDQRSASLSGRLGDRTSRGWGRFRFGGVAKVAKSYEE